MTAIICVIAPFSIIVPFSPIPISAATLAIYFSVTILGMKRGTLSIILYLLLGLAGLPVFSNFTGGIGILLGPTGGYLMGYIFLALLYGFFLDRWPNSFGHHTAGILLGTGFCYLFGALWLSYQAAIPFTQAILTSVLPFLPGDFIKISIILLTGPKIRKRLARANLFF